MPSSVPSTTSILPLVIPLATSTTTFGLALFQYPVFRSFLHARPSIAGRPLSRYWSTLFRQWSLGIIISTALTSSITGFVAAYRLRNSRFPALAAAAAWYTAGALSSLSHFAFIPLVAGPIQKMAGGAETEYNDGQEPDIDYQPKDWNKEQQIEEINMEQQRIWLTWHTLRTWTVDAGAVLLFFSAFTKAFGSTVPL